MMRYSKKRYSKKKKKYSKKKGRSYGSTSRYSKLMKAGRRR